jgi:cyclic pyranopterin phosphate synthase
MTSPGQPSPSPLVDRFNRKITYLRLSVTDRCDLRCQYCMPDRMTFLPRRDLLTLEELDTLAAAFVARGVRKIRVTGGEPLVRRDVVDLFKSLSRHLVAGAIDELTLTTNGAHLAENAAALHRCGVRRVNVSLDTLDPALFRDLTRRGALAPVLEGIDAAQSAGMHVKINTVALKDANEHEICSLIEWAHGRGMDLTLIEIMPMGAVETSRADQFLSLASVRARLEQRWTLTPLEKTSGGPARYVRIEETGGLLGFITPLTNNFCAGCNRVRVTCTGRIYMCLGQENCVDLRAAMRGPDSDRELQRALDRAMSAKPERHDFAIGRKAPALDRHMSVSGG